MESWDIEDPSDWPSQFVELKKLDSLLRCSICFDYFDIAVIVPVCSHNYCSLCIRKHISYHKYCPSCNKNLDDSDLKPNRVLDELVNHFKAVRKKLLAFCKQEKEVAIETEDELFEDSIRYRNPQNRSHISPEQSEPTCSRKLSRNGSSSSSSRNLSRNGSKDSSGSTDKLTTQNADTSDKVDCPVCQCKVSSKTINTHLDVCLHGNSRPKRKMAKSPDRKDQPKTKKFFHGQAKGQLAEKKQVETANDLITVNDTGKRKRLPKMCLDVMNDKQLKTKLKSFHLPIKGDRQTLKKRLKEFYLLYDSQCDSENPMSEQAIANEIIQREKEVSSMAYKPELIATHDHRLSIEQKKKINEEHSKRNNEQYNKLIEDVRKRKVTRSDNEEKPSPQTKYTFNISPMSEEGEPVFEDFDEPLSVFPAPPKETTGIIKDEHIIKNERIRVKEEKNFVGNEVISIEDDELPEDEFVFDTEPNKTSKQSKKKLTPQKTVRKIPPGKNKGKGKVRNKQSSSMIENYFTKVSSSKPKHSASYTVESSSKRIKVDPDYVPQSDSNSDAEDNAETTLSNIPESPEMFQSPYFNNTVTSVKEKAPRTLNSTTIGKRSAARSCQISVSPIDIKSSTNNITPNVKKKSPRKLLGSFALDALQTQNASQIDLPSVNSSPSNNLDSSSFNNHLDTLVENVYDQKEEIDSDATLSDVDIVPDPPSEYDFTFTESQMY